MLRCLSEFLALTAPQVGNTPLHLACSFGHADVVVLLCERGGDVNARNQLGLAPLARAAWKGELACARLLLARGADVHAVNNDGRTALDAARSEAMQDLLRAAATAR